MRQIGFIAGADGAVVKYDPKLHAVKPPPKSLTRHQRATLYFTAIRYIQSLFQEVGFRPVTFSGHSEFTIELGDFILEMSVQVPPPMAHVTSYAGYVYDPKRITAKVTSLSPGEPGEYVIRVIATLPNMRTCNPVYVVVDKHSDQPLKDAFMSALNSARDLIKRDPETMRKIQQAMASRNLDSDFERFRAKDEERQLTD